MSVSRVRVKALGKKENSKLSKAVYCLAPMHDNIVDAVLKIMDEDGPRPMRNMKPAQKQRTAGERFEIEHHGEYEARGQQSQSRIARVDNHNAAYPKLYDELEKKRSMAKPAAFTTNRKQSGAYCVCKQMKNRPQRNSSKRNKTRKNTKPHRSTGVTKQKQKTKQRNRSPGNFRFSRLRMHRGCQCSYRRKLVEKCVSTYNHDCLSVPVNMAVNFDKCESKQDFEVVNGQKPLRVLSISSIKKEPKSEGDLQSQIQDPSLPSVTSYNSYLSMDHEPMVE